MALSHLAPLTNSLLPWMPLSVRVVGHIHICRLDIGSVRMELVAPGGHQD
jgi:hypothetical protein